MRTNNQKKIFIFIVLFLVLGLFLGGRTFANNNEVKIKLKEYTKEYQKWLELPEEERSKVLAPRMFEIPKNTYYSSNPLKRTRMLKSSLISSYDLRSVIPENMIIRNQMDTNSCWAFASLAALETNLALEDVNNNVTNRKQYDFSERHMEYTTSRKFLNDQINESGYNRSVGDGGTINMAITYLINGLGAINESSMPFENNENLIDINEIKNKLITSKVTDTIDFPSYEITDDITQIKKQMKEHIKNYGGIIANIHGATVNSNYYNNKTGAIYCENAEICPIDHGVLIVGWDDDFKTTDFALVDVNEDGDYDDPEDVRQPKNPGAWIIKNSWGDKLEENLEELIELAKQVLFELFGDVYIENGYTDASKVPDDDAMELITSSGYTIDGDKAIYKIGDEGFMYISYEDVNIYSLLTGIIKSSNSLDYENIYQYDEHGYTVPATLNNSNIYLANIFEKKTNEKELLTQVSIYAPETYTCRVYVNPQGVNEGENLSTGLELVTLKSGETESFGAGYHTLEFLNPVEITGNNYVVVVEIQGTRQDVLDVGLEVNIPDTPYDVIKSETGKCFVTDQLSINTNTWVEFVSLLEVPADTTIKAFTISDIKDIEIITPPAKTDYFIGEDFDTTNMVVKANYNSGASEIITDYKILDGIDLKENQATVTLMYRNKTVTQSITVTKEVDSITVKQLPTKTEYIQNKEDLDLSNGIITITYKDGTTEELAMTSSLVQVSGFDNTNLGQVTITLTYKTKTLNFTIEIIAEAVEPDAPTQPDNPTEPDDPTQPDNPTEPDDPTQPDNPTEPDDPTEPDNPAEPDDPTLPDNPAEPDDPTQPDNPAEPDDPTQPDNPAEPDDPTQPDDPAEPNDPTQPDDPIVPDEPVEPENSNFARAQGNVKNIKAYYYTDKNKNDYVVMETEVTGIEKNKNNDSVEYYYYLSPNQEEGYIQNWVKINETQSIENNKLNFIINTKDIKNYQEVSNADVLYLYIKEVAIKDSNQKTVITNAMQLQTNVVIEEYVDDVKKEGIRGDDSDYGSGIEEDNTTADGVIPQAGQSIIIICSIVLITVLGVVKFIKYKNIDK